MANTSSKGIPKPPHLTYQVRRHCNQCPSKQTPKPPTPNPPAKGTSKPHTPTQHTNKRDKNKHTSWNTQFTSERDTKPPTSNAPKKRSKLNTNVRFNPYIQHSRQKFSWDSRYCQHCKFSKVTFSLHLHGQIYIHSTCRCWCQKCRTLTADRWLKTQVQLMRHFSLCNQHLSIGSNTCSIYKQCSGT